MALTVAGAWSYAGRDPSGRVPTSSTSSCSRGAHWRSSRAEHSAEEATQLLRNRYVIVSNPRDPGRRRYLIGSTDGGRVLTLVIERPSTRHWLAHRERRILSRGDEQEPLDRP